MKIFLCVRTSRYSMLWKSSHNKLDHTHHGSAAALGTRFRFRFRVRTPHCGQDIALAIAATQHELQAACLHGATHGARMAGSLHTGQGCWMTTGCGAAGTLALAPARAARPGTAGVTACCPLPAPMLPLPRPLASWC